MIGNHLPPLFVEDPQDRFAYFPRRQVLGTFQAERLAWSQIGLPFGVAVGAFQANHSLGQRRSDANPNPHMVAGQFHSHRGIQIGVLGRPDLLDRIPVLAPGLGLARLQERKVGLVVGIGAGHQLDVRAIAIREVAVPRVAEFMVTPRPLLLARGNMVIDDMHETGVAKVVVSTEKVLRGVPRHMYDVGTGMFAYQERSLGA